MTRAEEALFITGSLGTREKEPAADSWYARLAETAEGEWAEDPIWDRKLEIGSQPELPSRHAEVLDLGLPLPEPRWLRETLAAEPRPPRPLAPSSLGEDSAADPPYAPGTMADAARRGTLIHRLLERLPELAEAEREAAALRWLARAAADLDPSAHSEMADAAVRVLAQADWAGLFSPSALAEVPVTALVGDRVVAGTIDRLLVTPDLVRIVDFKTGRRPPSSLAEVPLAYLRQMAAYAAALEVAYPGRRIEAALLFTQVPVLIEIPADVIAVHKRDLSTGE
jgi:ATP-dependent helicase/nuclease subunit A